MCFALVAVGWMYPATGRTSTGGHGHDDGSRDSHGSVALRWGTHPATIGRLYWKANRLPTGATPHPGTVHRPADPCTPPLV